MTAEQLSQAGFLGNAAAALCYLGLALFFLLFRRRGAYFGLFFVLACFASALWLAAASYDFRAGLITDALGEVLSIVRDLGWMVLLLALLYWVPPVWRSSWAAIIFALCIAIAAFAAMFGGSSAGRNVDSLLYGGHMLLALIGLGLVENLYRNSPAQRRWNIKYISLGVGALFAYDFYIYADALLFHRANPDLFVARGVINLLVIPTLAVYAQREQSSGPRVAVSRRFVLYTATVVGAGLYLMTMAAAGYYVRRFGGSWSGFLQTVFFFGTALLLIVPLSSGSFRAYFRILLEKSFFQYKYDYRTEWLRFIATMSSPEPGEDRRRPVIQAVGDIVDSPDGGIWLRREDDQFNLAAAWNMSRWQLVEVEAVIPIASSLVSFLESRQWVINLEEFATHPNHYPGLSEVPPWLQTATRAWLVLPLVNMEHLYGVMILGRARVSRQLTWEDFDLLKTVSRQAASYLAEQDTSVALAAARQFEAFNKRFAFVIHDIKNLASQLALILSNAEKHRGNQQFQNDMIETVRQSVEKINRMLKQLHAEPERSAPRTAVELAALLRDIVATQKQLGPDISLELLANGLAVAADEDRLKAVVEQLVQNAVEAVGGKGRVQVRLAGDGKMAIIEVEDDGPGMDDEFVRDKLFHPFATTKGVGYGIGAYESRDFASSLGGRLEVTSRPGRGTIMRMRLPAIGST